jgi:NADH/NAD ratio-sensing transcriptional regulator Rex
MWDAEEALHHIYELISFEKRHKHIGITNDNRKAQEVIDYMIEHNFKGILEAL